MKKLLIILLILVASMVLFGCGEATPTSSPSVSKTDQTIETHELYDVQFAVLSARSSTYAIGVILADTINKESDWLRATCPEGVNMDVNLKSIVQGGQEAEQHTFVWASNGGIWDANRHIGAYGDPPFNAYDYNEIKHLFFWGMAGNVLVTLDPEIKTIEDLEGRKGVVDDTPGGNRYAVWKVIFEKAGVQIEPEWIKRAEAIEALKDGLIEFWLGGVEPQPGGEWKAGAGLPDLIATEDVYYIDVDASIIEAVIEELDFPGVVLTVPANKMGETQPQPFNMIANSMWWGAHEDMPDEVVTEFMRIVYDTCETWKEHKPDRAVVSKDTLAAIGAPESRYHPAALKFYEEHGVALTTYGK